MSSSRLPGKVLHRIEGTPLLGYLLERLRCAERVGTIVVATSDDETDEPIVEFCATTGTTCFQGSLENVARRYAQLLEAFPAEGYIRVCGDSPLLDPGLVDEVVALYAEQTPDLATNVFPRSFPKGQSVEVFGAQSFRSIYDQLARSEDREHVTQFFYRYAARYRIVNLSSGLDCAGESLAIDTTEDMESFRVLVTEMDRPHWTYGWKELLEMKRALTHSQG